MSTNHKCTVDVKICTRKLYKKIEHKMCRIENLKKIRMRISFKTQTRKKSGSAKEMVKKVVEYMDEYLPASFC